MKIESLKEFIKRTKTSRSSIYRFYKNNPELKAKIIFRKKYYYPIEHAKYFDSEIMFDENKQLNLENKSMRNLINCLMDRDSLQMRLWYMEWSHSFTIAYKLERSKKYCFRMMHGLYETLIERYGDRTEIRIFFTTEPFTNRNGYHNHFYIYIAQKSLEEQILDDINLYFEYDRVQSTLYDRFKAGLFYISKEGLVNEDWDILGNNLKEVGAEVNSNG